MPYRRLPKTDKARLKALKTILENNDIYTVRNRLFDWQTLNQARPAYDRLLTASEQYRLCLATQVRNAKKIEKLQRNATLYISHFLQVLFMAVERGEIKKQSLSLYDLPPTCNSVPNLKNIGRLLEWGQKIIEGERQRLKKGGRPIYNPTIGMVSTHYDIFRETYEAQQALQQRTARAQEALLQIRPDVDSVVLELWNQIEAHFSQEPPETRFKKCRELGVVYYYRRHEPHEY